MQNLTELKDRKRKKRDISPIKGGVVRTDIALSAESPDGNLKECAGYILEKNVCTFFPHKTGRTFPDGNPKAKFSMKAMACLQAANVFSDVRFARVSCLGTASPPPLTRWKIKHRTATTNENKIRTNVSRGNGRSQAIKQFNRLIHRRWVTGLLGTVTQAHTQLLRWPSALGIRPSSAADPGETQRDRVRSLVKPEKGIQLSEGGYTNVLMCVCVMGVALLVV